MALTDMPPISLERHFNHLSERHQVQKHLVISQNVPEAFIVNPVLICLTVTAQYFVVSYKMTKRPIQFIQILHMNDFSEVLLSLSLPLFFGAHFCNVSEDELANNSEC